MVLIELENKLKRLDKEADEMDKEAFDLSMKIGA